MHLPIVPCCGMHCCKLLRVSVSVPCMVCVSVPFSKLYEHARHVVVHTKVCLKTNYIAVPSFMCQFCSINIAPFDVVCTLLFSQNCCGITLLSMLLVYPYI